MKVLFLGGPLDGGYHDVPEPLPSAVHATQPTSEPARFLTHTGLTAAYADAITAAPPHVTYRLVTRSDADGKVSPVYVAPDYRKAPVTIDVIAFLNARYDERAQAALAATGDLRQAGITWSDISDHIRNPASLASPDAADHAALNSPNDTLADLDAKRRIIAALDLTPCPCARARRCVIHDSSAGPPELAVKRYVDPITEAVLTALALPFASHPDYREEWNHDLHQQ